MPSNPRRGAWLLPLLLTPALLWGCWTAPFSPVDDVQYIAENPALRPDAGWGGIVRGAGADPVYIPLTYLTLKADRAVYEPLLGGTLGAYAWPAGVRTTNLILHALACVLVFWLVRGLGASLPLAGFVAAACALHPTAGLSVCWGIQRKTLLSGCLGFAALGLYVRAGRPWHYGLAACGYLLALLAKPSALGLAPAVVLWECLGRPRMEGYTGSLFRPADGWRATALRLAPWAALSVLAPILCQELLSRSGGALRFDTGALWSMLATDVTLLWRYVALLLWPLGDALAYTVLPVESPSEPRLWGCAAALLACGAAAWAAAPGAARRLCLWCALAFAGAVFPTLNYPPRLHLFGDQYIYLAVPFFWLAVGLAIQGAWRRINASNPLKKALTLPSPARGEGRTTPLFQRAVSAQVTTWAAAAGLGLAALLWASLSAARAPLFADWELLFADSAAREPDCAYNHILLGQIRREKRKLALARGQAEAARMLLESSTREFELGLAAPDYRMNFFGPQGNLFLAESYFDAGRYAEAAGQLDRVLATEAGAGLRGQALPLRARCALQQGLPLEAARFFAGALELDPQNAALLVGRGAACLALSEAAARSGAGEEAARWREEGLRSLQSVPPGDPLAPLAAQMLIKWQEAQH